MKLQRFAFSLLCPCLASAILWSCATDTSAESDGGAADAGGAALDGGAVQTDGGAVAPDDAEPADAGGPQDAGENDAGVAPVDAGENDSGGVSDASGPNDAGSPADPCQPIKDHAGWELCESTSHSCAGLFTNGEGCTAYCAAAGMICTGAFGGDPGCVKDPNTPEQCESGHKSDWCECSYPVGQDAGTPDAGQNPDAGADAGTPDAGTGPPPSKLPFTYTRPNAGTPVSAAELAALTDRYLELLNRTHYFEALDDRIHGWPEGDPRKRYWYGTWWSGVSIEKQGGKVTFVHGATGADNNGLRTAQVMEAACYAYLLWGKAAHKRLLNKNIRGFNSWIMAIERKPNDTPVMLARAAYLENITAADNGKTYTIDYSKNRPGLDNGATEYVNVPNNPHWGNIWVKNKRSKDCLGHMFRGLGQMESCAARLSGDEAQQLQYMRDKYAAWSRQVEADGWKIATLNKSGQVWYPTDDLANFYTIGGVECAGQLMLRLMGHGDPGTLACGSGISSLEEAAYFNADLIKTGNKSMMHAYHEAAINQALVAGQDAVALSLVKGLADRLDRTMNYIEQQGKMPDNVTEQDFVQLIMHAANAGVPLTSREVRWLHERLDRATRSYNADCRIFSGPSTEYEPNRDGIEFKDLGLPLGSCASQYRNPAGQPLLDCKRVEQFQ